MDKLEETLSGYELGFSLMNYTITKSTIQIQIKKKFTQIYYL